MKQLIKQKQIRRLRNPTYGCHKLGRGRDSQGVGNGHVHFAIFKVDNQEPTIQHMELCSMLCGSPDGKGVWRRMDTCICMAETLHCSPETITKLLTHYQFSSVTQSCPTLCDPMNRSTPGLPVHHQLPEFTQTHVHRVSDAIQPSHPLSSLSPPAPNPSQHQSLFQ